MTCEMSGKPHRLRSAKPSRAEPSARLRSPALLLASICIRHPSLSALIYSGDDPDRNGGETGGNVAYLIRQTLVMVVGGVGGIFFDNKQHLQELCAEIPLTPPEPRS